MKELILIASLILFPFAISFGSEKIIMAVMTYNGQANYFPDMMAYTDRIVGSFSSKLKELGIEDNTIILFIGDNGTDVPIVSDLDGRIVAGSKGETTDAGTRVPLIVKWNKKFKAGSVSQDLVDLSDVLPTVCQAGNIKVPDAIELYGQSFLPQLYDNKGNPREWIYVSYSPSGKNEKAHVFASNHRFKLYTSGEFFEIPKDYQEQNSSDYNSLSSDKKAVYDDLRTVLESYQNRRLENIKHQHFNNQKHE